MVQTDVFSTFLISVIALWSTKQIAGGGLKATPSAIFAASSFYALFGLLFLGFPWGAIFHQHTIYWLLILDAVLLPIFIFWFSGKFLDGFELKAKKYYPKAIALFMLFTFVGVVLVQMLPLVGLGIFGGGGYCVNRYSRPYWMYSRDDYWYYYA